MSLKSSLFVAVITTCIVFAGTRVEAQAPSLSCRPDRQGAGATMAEPVTYTNLERIRLTVRVDGNMALLEEPALRFEQRSAGNIKVEAVRLDGARRTAVDIQLRQMGYASNDLSRELFVDVGIPVKPERRAAAINEFIARVERSATNSPEDQQNLRYVQRNRDALIKSLEQRYSEHEVGLFELRCSYSSSTSGKWNGAQSSAPLYLRVTDAGKFFDQPEFKE